MTYLPPTKTPAIVEPRLLDLHSAYHCPCDSLYPKSSWPIDPAHTAIQWLLEEAAAGPFLNTGTAGSPYNLIVEPYSATPPPYGNGVSPTTTTSPIGTTTAIYAASGNVRLVTNDNAAKASLSASPYLSVSAWVKVHASSPLGRIVEKKWADDNTWSSPYTGAIMLAFNGSGTELTSWGNFAGFSPVQLNAGFACAYDTWYHVAATYDATIAKFYLYVNGVQKAGWYWGNAHAIQWGAGRWETMSDGSPGNPFPDTLKGGVWDVRVEPGVIRDATYYLDQYHSAADSLAEVSLHRVVPTPGTTIVLDTVNKMAGAASLLFDGSQDACIEIVSPQWGLDEFTIEMWVRWTGTSTTGAYPHGHQALFRCGNQFLNRNPVSIGATGPHLVVLDHAIDASYPTGALSLGVIVSSTSYSWQTATTATPGYVLPMDGTWHHVAVQRENIAEASYFTLYVDGVKITYVASSGGSALDGHVNDPRYITVQQPYMQIGCNLSGALGWNYPSPWKGNIDEIRITTGRRRYLSNFTPVQAAFVDEAVPPHPVLGEVRISSNGDFYECVNVSANIWRRLVTIG